jgi:histidyl-tRNA synthetase
MSPSPETAKDSPAKAPNKSPLQRPKGTQDILPANAPAWHHVENTARRLFEQANYREIRTPIFESTDLFERGVGESTDIVNKEMYTFIKEERSLTLRPENTAGVVRAYIEQGLSRQPKPVKLYYIGPMFRYERPQAGRQRQFHQVGVECFGLDTPASDAETIQLAMTLFDTLGLKDLALQINNIGCPDCREAFKQQLKTLVEPALATLCQPCQNRYVINPLRMLDCKEPGCQTVYGQDPVASFLEQDSTCEACQTHFTRLTEILTGLGIPFQRNKRLVRGLDYYTRTVFEITCMHLGAQNAVCGGGRYNGLVESLGGPATPAVGWAVGMERLISLLPEQSAPSLDFYIVSDDPVAALTLAKAMRATAPVRVEVDTTGKGFGKQLAQADKLGARHAVLLGADELASQQVTIKTLASGEQATQTRDAFLSSLASG